MGTIHFLNEANSNDTDPSNAGSKVISVIQSSTITGDSKKIFLMSRGFGYHIIEKAINRFWKL